MGPRRAPADLLPRLRANLQAAGIELSDVELARVGERGLLPAVLAFEALAERTPSDLVPDYLGSDDSTGPPVGAALQPEPPAGASSPPTDATDAATARRGDREGRGNRRELEDASITELASHLRRREVSPVEVTEQALARIAARDARLNAFQLVLPERALAAAHRAARELATGTDRGPLHGVPLAAKDLLAMAGTTTTAGSKILADWVTDFDAAAIERLEAAGAVIVGKTRMSEFAYSPGSNNDHYGPTRNPWNPARDTGGSSSGSAAAVADRLVYGALGSDTGGSIRMPAALCGLVGLKPTFGRVSLHGAVPLSWSLDHLGPMTRTVADAAVMLQVLAGPDPRDPRTRRVPVPDYGATLKAGVRGLRIGVLRDDGSGGALATPDALAGWHRGLETLARGGAELIELDLPAMQDVRTVNTTLVLLEAAAYHHRVLRAQRRDLGEFVRTRLLSAFALEPTAMARAQQVRRALRERAGAVFVQVDLLSTPAMPYGAPPLGDPARNTTFTAPFNTLGWPAITVPVDLTGDGLPLGLQLVGKPWTEELVLRAAAVVEAEGPWHRERPPANVPGAVGGGAY